MSALVQRKLQQAHQQLGQGNVAAAAALCEDVLKRAANNPMALWLLGTARMMQQRLDLAIPLLERATTAAPDKPAALENLGLAYLMSGDFAAAEKVLRQAVNLPAAATSARMRLGVALLQGGQHAAAIEELERAVRADPAEANARLNLGRAYAAAARWPEAVQAFDAVLAAHPASLDALFNLGVASAEIGATAKARCCFEQILGQDSSYADAQLQLGLLEFRLGRFGKAIAVLRELSRARPGDSELWLTLANACFQQGELTESESCAREALRLDARSSGAYSLLGQIHLVRGELDEALTILARGYDLTRSAPLLGLRVQLLRRTCAWSDWAPAWAELAPLVDTLDDVGSPFFLLFEDTTAAQQLSYTRRWAAARFRGTRPTASRGPRSEGRLRIGYFSPDFHEHATSYLLAEVLEAHDRRRFETFAYSYGPEDHSAMRARMRGAVEHFIDVAWQPQDEVVKQMRANDLDVLVDLKGYLVGDRLEIMAERPGRIQVEWLGYPATTGVDFIDYVIADGYVIPQDAEAFYSEKVLRMPHCYQPNDRKRSAEPPLSRAAYGLPDGGFVFACFNQSVKITPEVFARWMSLLRRVPDSVLWVLEDNRWATANLKTRAIEHGVSAARIVIAERRPQAAHLARYRVADLALDTFPYTSHTTASDALWLGCPLVGLTGCTFASRVSGSILLSCGLAELVTDSLDAYEATAYRFATDASYMRAVRERLASIRMSSPLFDAEAFARDLEQLFLTIAS